MASEPVVCCKCDTNGNPIGSYNQNLLWIHIVPSVMLMAMNVIVGFHFDHRNEGGQKVVVTGKDTFRQSTAGWGISCEGTDSSTFREKSSNLNKLHLIQIAKYASTQGIEHELSFN